MELRLELEWELDVDLGAGMGAAVELLYNTRYTIPAIQYPLGRLASSKTRFWPKTAFRAPGGQHPNRNKQFWRPFSKMENVLFGPGDPAIQSQLSFAFNAKSALSAEP